MTMSRLFVGACTPEVPRLAVRTWTRSRDGALKHRSETLYRTELVCEKDDRVLVASINSSVSFSDREFRSTATTVGQQYQATQA